MSTNNVLVWNAREVNGLARRSVVREFVVKERASVVCLQETKVERFASISVFFAVQVP
jgi:exonuclease III